MNARTVFSLGTTVVALGGLAYVATLAFQPGAAVEVSAVVPVVAAPADPAPSVAGAQGSGSGTAGSGASASTSVSQAWVEKTAAKAGISTVALRAYANAQLAAPASCGLGWTTLAGIGWVESHHGTIDGRTLSTTGVPSAPITGIPLGDLDRAYGPMQFIPSTWATWGADADGDGTADPQNINDAALAAAHYLCASGSLASGASWAAAIYSYNHSQTYVDQVYAAAQEYAARTS
jgi:hypothetical protein